MMENAFAIVMAGGAGTRFWPASRAHRPKQLLPLGRDREVLLSATVRRIAPVIPSERVLVAANRLLAPAIHTLLPNVPEHHVLAEPMARNTAPCIGWATATIARTHPEALVAVLPSDHAIADESAFLTALRTALTTASTGPITTIGILPTRPDTGYGYIEIGEVLRGEVRKVARFVEKPVLALAQQYLGGGKHWWNAGMFFFRAHRMLEAIRTHLPALHDCLSELDAAARSGREEDALPTVFARMQSISIDYGVIEKEAELAVVPGSFGWSDLGSWESAWELASKDANENALPDGAIAVESHRNYVTVLSSGGSKKLVALVGVDDLAVVETDDAILVLPRKRSQDVRLIVDELKKRGRTGLL